MKVVAIRRLKLPEPVPVYDVSVPGLENFKLANGPFIHNSKDVSDALAGVVFGLTMRREMWAIHQVPTGIIPSAIKDAMKKAASKEEKTTTKGLA